VEVGEVQEKGHERSHSEGDSRIPSAVDGPSFKADKKSTGQNQTSVKQIISQLMTSTNHSHNIPVDNFKRNVFGFNKTFTVSSWSM
jgi:hypothetical protein